VTATDASGSVPSRTRSSGLRPSAPGALEEAFGALRTATPDTAVAALGAARQLQRAPSRALSSRRFQRFGPLGTSGRFRAASFPNGGPLRRQTATPETTDFPVRRVLSLCRNRARSKNARTRSTRSVEPPLQPYGYPKILREFPRSISSPSICSFAFRAPPRSTNSARHQKALRDQTRSPTFVVAPRPFRSSFETSVVPVASLGRRLPHGAATPAPASELRVSPFHDGARRRRAAASPPSPGWDHAYKAVDARRRRQPGAPSFSPLASEATRKHVSRETSGSAPRSAPSKLQPSSPATPTSPPASLPLARAFRS
jgi:hypothetical protein